jgi:hypothetical protein
MTLKAFTDIQGKQPNSSLEKEKMVRHESLPLNEGVWYYKLPPVASAQVCITEQAVELA